jgi:hypothetical protein
MAPDGTLKTRLPGRPPQRVEDWHVGGGGYDKPCGGDSAPPNRQTRGHEIADDDHVQAHPSAHPRPQPSPSDQTWDQGEVGKADDACAAWIREANKSSELRQHSKRATEEQRDQADPGRSSLGAV